ncbi:MAG: hypothetical protein ACREPJ_14890 [Rhodanobacteraceae bacterium]
MFQVLVRTAGYADWSRSDVHVAATRCGDPIGVSLTAKLQR